MKIIAPTNCPSCNAELVLSNSILYCINKTCPAQGLKTIENFSKILKIVGLGPARIEKLDIHSIVELYSLTEEFIVSRLGDTIGTKLYAQIQSSKNASLNQVLPALGIPLIGKVAADKICAKFSHLTEITEELALTVLGPQATANLMAWIQTEEYKELPFSFKSEKINSADGPSVCITGKLFSFKTKSEAAAYLTQRGYKVVSSVTKDTVYLVNESGIESEKTKKASANGTIIINNIMELI